MCSFLMQLRKRVSPSCDIEREMNLVTSKDAPCDIEGKVYLSVIANESCTC